MEKDKEQNKELVKRFPFLMPPHEELDYDYEHTLLDDMPPGWRKSFGVQMCEEIAQVLYENDYLDKYKIAQIKEKFGELRWYDFGAPDKVQEIIDKYSRISAKTCISCGKPATRITLGWIAPYCDDCIKPIYAISKCKDIGEMGSAL